MSVKFLVVSILTIYGLIRADDLVAVTLLYRHGDRAIIDTYPNDPYKNASFWPVPYGELTNTGKRQHFVLGRWLRQYYNSFLSTEYLAKEIHIHSSYRDRCFMSAASNLAGLYPPQGDQVWNPKLPWQPIPIHTIPKKLDNILALKKLCPKMTKLLNELLQTERYQNSQNANEELYAYLTEKTGMKVNNFTMASYVYDVLLVEKMYNYILPEWTKQVFPDKLRHLTLIRFKFPTETPELAKFHVGLFFDKVLKQFDDHAYNAHVIPKFQVFSGHDTNVFNVLNSLGIPNLELVPYAGMIIFELKRRKNGKYYVQFLYKKGKTLNLLKIKGCSTECGYDEFKSILKPLSLSDEEWDEACMV